MMFCSAMLFWIIVFLGTNIVIHLLPKSRRMRSLYGRHVVVTGGSSGIGLQVAVSCAKKGANITLVARNSAILKKAVELLNLNRISKAQTFLSNSVDLASCPELVEKAFQDMESSLGPIYMLVNCAGTAVCGVFEEVPVNVVEKLMKVNYFASYYCIRSVLPKMKKRGEGVIVITGSISSLVGLYGYGPYTAAKFALRGMAETIAMESKHLGVSVTLALPCDTDTPGFHEEGKSKPVATKMLSEQGGLAKPADIAQIIVQDALRGSFFSVVGIESWMIALLCCGMAPWNELSLVVLQFILMGPLRIISLFINWQFSKIVQQYG